MSAILSADDLNDFISPGVACIKPVEVLPKEKPPDQSNPYEVTTEDKVAAADAPAAQISLTDCLACSGCVTSAEAVLVSLQSHSEVLSTLNAYPSLDINRIGSCSQKVCSGACASKATGHDEGKIFVASVSPQTRASLAATFGISSREAGYMIEQLMCGPHGIRTGGEFKSGFEWVVDTNVAREICLVLGAEEVLQSLSAPKDTGTEQEGMEGAADTKPKKPILTSVCPGWICYAEKTHPHILPHLSRLKSPQALLGTMLKTTLAKKLRVNPDRIWHLAIMPCFDKKLEASRQEFTDVYWREGEDTAKGVRDVDCVITTKELLMLADSRGVKFSAMPRMPLDRSQLPSFPDEQLSGLLFPELVPSRGRQMLDGDNRGSMAGTSGGYLFHILQTLKSQNPGSEIRAERGRNADVVEYTLVRDSEVLFKGAKYYGFRNIQNLVRRLKPAKKSRLPGGRVGMKARPAAGARQSAGSVVEASYVEVMACPGGCTNGGGQIKASEVAEIRQKHADDTVSKESMDRKEWLAQVDEAYFSGEGSDNEDAVDGSTADSKESEMAVDIPPSVDLINGIPVLYITSMVNHWSTVTEIPLDKLAFTSYRKVESDVGKNKMGDTERVVELAGRIGGGW